MDAKKIAEIILQQIEKGAGCWEMPWHKGLPEAFNPLTQKPYRGYNTIALWQAGLARGYNSSEWATLYQWRKLGGKVRRGAKGVRVVKPIGYSQRDLLGEHSQVTTGFRHYTVFNYEDINGINRSQPDLFDTVVDAYPYNDLAERVVLASKAKIVLGCDSAYYRPSTDTIHMPHRTQFISTTHSSASENYYATLLHELVHWTKPVHRCNRKAMFEQHSAAYAFEELVAELGAALLNTRFHKLPEPRLDHAAYLEDWLWILETDFNQFFKAVALAQQAADWLCERADIHQSEGNWSPAPVAEPIESTTPLPEQEKRIPPVVAAQTIQTSSHHSGFVTHIRYRVLCGACHKDFNVTLHRTDTGCRCEYCARFNLLKLQDYA